MPDWERKYMGRWKMPNDDYILRSDAVFAFCGACEGTEICGQMGEPCDEVKRIRAIPAADVEPKRKTGRWVGMQEYCQHLFDTTGERYIMSQLGISLPHCNQCWAENESRKPFCPNCGAEMDAELPKGEKED